MRSTDLDGVEAARDAAVLHLDVGRRVRELALGVGPRALVARELATHFERQPARVFHVGVEHAGREERVDDGHGRRCSHVELWLRHACERRRFDGRDERHAVLCCEFCRSEEESGVGVRGGCCG